MSARDHRYGMRRFAVGVSVITASDGDARAGLTATAVCSVTADPPRLVHRRRQERVRLRQDPRDRRALLTGALALEGALASFDCRVVEVFGESTRQAFPCEVLATRERASGRR